jgi:putative endonuclease
MYYVYILKSLKDSNLYLGSSNDLRRRLAEHNAGKSFSTKARRPFELRYYEAYFNEEDARSREQSLKDNGRTLAQLKRRLGKSLL